MKYLVGKSGIWRLIWNPNFPYRNKREWLSSSQNMTGIEPSQTWPLYSNFLINLTIARPLILAGRGNVLQLKLFQVDDCTITLLGNYKGTAYYWMVLRSGSSPLTDINWIWKYGG